MLNTLSHSYVITYCEKHQEISMHCGRRGRGRMLGKWPPQGSNSCILWKILSPSQNSGAVGDEYSLRKRFTWQRCTSASMLAGGRPLCHPAFSASLLPHLPAYPVSPVFVLISPPATCLAISSAYQTRSRPSSQWSTAAETCWDQHPFQGEAQMTGKHVTVYLADLVPKDLENIISGGAGGC